MDANLSIQELRGKIKNDILHSGLPSGVCLYLVKDIAQELDGLFNQHCAVASWELKKEAEQKEVERKGDANG